MKLHKLFHLLALVALVALVACAPTLGPAVGTPTPTASPPPPVVVTAIVTEPGQISSPAAASDTPIAPTKTAALPTYTEPSPSRQPPSATPTTAPSPTAPVAPCTPTDQDLYVYNPGRLRVMAACLRVSGVIDAIRTEADGDLHILLKVDPEFTNLLTAANQGEELGDLVVEPVCVKAVTQADAESTCAADGDPFAGPFPQVGQHVWMEGRYVLDVQHSSWAELHPLYHWGTDEALPVGTFTPVATLPTPANAPLGKPTATQAQQVAPSDTPAPPPAATDTQAAARVRVGAHCNDGTESSATGSGACSHHKGVQCWNYSDGTCTQP